MHSFDLCMLLLNTPEDQAFSALTRKNIPFFIVRRNGVSLDRPKVRHPHRVLLTVEDGVVVGIEWA